MTEGKQYDIENEKAVVASVLLEGWPSLDKALNVGLEPVCIFDERLRLAYRAAIKLAQAGQPIDALTVKNALADNGELEKVDVVFLADITTGIPAALNVKAYAQQVVKNYRQRRLMGSLDNAIKALQSGNGSFAAARVDLEKALADADSPTCRKFNVGTATKALQPQPDFEWLFRNFLARHWVSIWFGEPGCKKTFSILDQAVCLAMGEPWLGFTTTRSTVLIIDEESGEQRLLRRLGDAMRGHGAAEDTPISYVSLHGFNLTEESGARELEELVKEVAPGLVIVDAMADLMLGGDENLVRDTQPILVRLRRIAERQDCAIEVVHHVNKAGEYRGSTALKGAVDTMILVESAPDSPTVTFSAEKTRDVIIKPFGATAHFDLGKFCLSEADLQPRTAKLTPSEKYVIKYLQTHGASTVEDIKNHADVCEPQTAKLALYRLAALEPPLVRRVDGGGTGAGHKAVYESV
jgi:hypothetical protein